MEKKEEWVHVRIDSKTLAWYSRFCEEHASNVSAMTRKLIADWVNEQKKHKNRF